MVAKESIKLSKVRKRDYIRTEEVKILMHYFPVPKGVDIRMVYNGTSSSLSPSLWAPHLYSTTVGSTLWAVGTENFMADFDIG